MLNKLDKIKIKWKKQKCMTIVLCSKGYPKKISKKHKELKNINKIKLKKDDFIYHAGTKFKNNRLVSNGGRVLNITSAGKNFLRIRKNIIKIIKKLIGNKVFLEKI